ncbi:hypothetical protein EJF36_06890 [Bacillus sp. HMF5848]|uniref:FixH family protein n=1 Tax=Bacillus sp. HMF5848 TaxID=2495421 RepID=UPI000F78D180|nr:FixH family protein [Bacillus sp. HMF5848]RSK26604.1 hypothetical protein EJF36_06890 [Bacillus sp. HMF5848]
MKKIITVFIIIFLLTGCNNTSSWDVSIVEAPSYNQGEPSHVVFQLSEDGKPLTGLDVVASFEMTKMDHGYIDIPLQENESGLYEGNITLPMAGEWEVLLQISNNKQVVEKIVTFNVENNEVSVSAGDVIASINGDEINSEDLAFYKAINQLQIAMYREYDRNRYEGAELDAALTYWDSQEKAIDNPNTLLTQIIRLRAVALLAKEKGHYASQHEIEAELNKVKQTYAASPAATNVIAEYGEERFWNKQQEQYELIVLSSKVQQDVIEKVKQANSEAETREVNVLAQKKYEELLVSQVGTLNIEIY